MKFIVAGSLFLMLCGIQSCDMGKFYAGKRIDGGETFKEEKFTAITIPAIETQKIRTQNENAPKEANDDIVGVNNHITQPGPLLNHDKTQETGAIIMQTKHILPDSTTSANTTLTKQAPSEEKKSLFVLGYIIVISLLYAFQIGLFAFLISWINNPIKLAFQLALPWAAGAGILVLVITLLQWAIWGVDKSHGFFL